MSPEEILQVADAGRRIGCKEALFTLGDRPEARFESHRRAPAALRPLLDPVLPGGDVPDGARAAPASCPTRTPASSADASWPSCARSRPARG